MYFIKFCFQHLYKLRNGPCILNRRTPRCDIIRRNRDIRSLLHLEKHRIVGKHHQTVPHTGFYVETAARPRRAHNTALRDTAVVTIYSDPDAPAQNHTTLAAGRRQVAVYGKIATAVHHVEQTVHRIVRRAVEVVVHTPPRRAMRLCRHTPEKRVVEKFRFHVHRCMPSSEYSTKKGQRWSHRLPLHPLLSIYWPVIRLICRCPERVRHTSTCPWDPSPASRACSPKPTR